MKESVTVAVSGWNMMVVPSLLGVMNYQSLNLCRIVIGWKSKASTIAQIAMSMTRVVMSIYLRRKEG